MLEVRDGERIEDEIHFLKLVFSALLMTIPAAIIFIGIGVLSGSVLSEKAVAGICGTLLTNLTA